MKKNRLKEIVKELRAASKMHAGQATEISAHVKDMAKGASRSSFGPAQTSASDIVGVAGNLLKGGAGIAASMLSTTSAEAGQNVRSQSDFNKQYPANEGVVNDGGELPNKKPKPKNEYVGAPKKKKNTCWKGYVAKGKKKSPSGKKNSDGSPKMVNNCVKISKKRR